MTHVSTFSTLVRETPAHLRQVPRPLAVAVVSVVLTALLSAEEPQSPASDGFVHPGIAHSQADLDSIRQKIDDSESPWIDAWNTTKQSRFASLQWEAEPVANVQRGASNNPDVGSSEFSNDAAAAYTHALVWAIDRNPAHARKSAEILDAWSGTLQSISNHDARLLVGMDGQEYLNAAELLRHTWDGWPRPNQEAFEKMVRDIWYPIIEDFYPSANGNWDASMLQTMIAMGVYLDDREMFDRAVQYYRNGKGNGAIGNYFNEFGECQESGRDQAHTQMGLDYLATTCETAWHQGLDLYGELDNRLLKGFEYTAKYNLGMDVPYEPYRSFEGRYFYKKISDDSRGRLRPMYEKVVSHYVHRQGLDAKYSQQAMLKLRQRAIDSDTPNRGRGDRDSRRRRRRPSGSLPWDTLMYATQANVSD
ncbi:alginate lyase family protein [Allorhodopirellula solitaria]|uniref:Alginate lyase n=1 Tax=Allorhodopirellula solitaria TaxID=2527987 RepID=A0A5C5YJG3_9BACT|nr:alginate lyase family protein [Allorhodopirellula solitaria]TWT75023.1 Alginate lyase [Allorhodopirellula solitaria]